MVPPKYTGDPDYSPLGGEQRDLYDELNHGIGTAPVQTVLPTGTPEIYNNLQKV
jgi:hypothetical protein